MKFTSYKSKAEVNPYNNAAWRRLRILQLQDQPLCEYCLHNRKLTPATQVDHAVPWTEDNDMMYDSENLISTCARCHQMITIQQQSMNFNNMTLEEAKIYKISKMKPEINENGYYD